ncbi:MAG: protein kinase [Pseudomonadota bacterium]
MRDTMQGLDAGAMLAGRFRLIRALGDGGNAEVWLAEDSDRDYTVALKIARPETPARALREEWQTLRALNHPHIVRVFDFFEEPVVFFAQYHVDGTDLAAVGSQGWRDTLRPVGLIARALRYLHARGVAHGDVVASNIVFDRGGSPFLVDFGSARRGDVVVGAGAGTAAAMSPERKAGGEPSAADDCYAFGVLLDELLHNAPDGGAGADARVTALIRSLRSADPAGRPPADEVERTLSACGISPGPLPAALVRSLTPAAAVPRSDATTEIAAVARKRTPPGEVPPAAVPQPARRGVSPAWVAGGAIGLLLLFVVLLNVLPQREPAAPPASRDSSAAAGVEAPADDTAAGDDAGTVTDDPFADEPIEFSEGQRDDSMRADAVKQKNTTDRVLGELLTKQDVLEARAAERWAPTRYATALARYEQGDRFYLSKDYLRARSAYEETIAVFDELLAEVDGEFERVRAEAQRALAAGDGAAARRGFELALAITPADPEAEAGLERARNLDDVLALTDAGLDAERSGDYEAALTAFDKALTIDSIWQPARDGRERARAVLAEQGFRQLMSDGFAALDDGRYDAARALFRQARAAKPGSAEPADGLLQVDQAARLAAIGRLEQAARSAETAEDWQAAANAYSDMLKQDENLAVAREGLARARSRIALDRQLESYLGDPDQLADESEMAAAAGLLTRLARIDAPGPRLTRQKEELSRVLKRAAQPVTVELRSDGVTEVAVFKVGRLGRFEAMTLELRPGVYTAVGTRAGYKDVRLEFRVAPEQPEQPVIVQSEEPI